MEEKVVLEYVVDVTEATTWLGFIEAFNAGFVRRFGSEWDGNLDAFNDYPYRLVTRGWRVCFGQVNQHLTRDKQPVMNVITEIIHSNPQVHWVCE